MNGKQAHKKILNIFSHKGNVMKTTRRYHYIPVRVAKIKILIISSAEEDIKQLCLTVATSCKS